MGGPLIAKILKDGQDKLSQHPRLILQSNIQTENLRQTLQQLNYEIIDEIIMEEKGHIYEIVVAEYSTQLIELSSDELKFGPKLLNNKNEYFIKKWQRELEALYHIKSKLNTEQHHQRLAQINQRIVNEKGVIVMKIADLMTLLDHHVPFSTAESWDNVGLLIGDEDVEVTGVLTALDCTLEVVNEAIEKGYNTIISHHPLIFKGVTSLKANGYGLIIIK